jgi:hypothetical protein
MTCKLFRPHFCGKCNLKLRGWDIYAQAGALLPECSGDDLAEAFPFAAVPVPPPPAPPHVKPQVRFIAGTVKDTDKAGGGLASLGVSFYPSDKAGELRTGENAFKLASLKPLHNAAAYDADSAADAAAFRVEVIEPNLAAAKLYVTLEALKPVYAGRAIKEWVPFPDPERPKRALVKVECLPLQSDKTCYRSRYLRLVTDEEDHKALAATKQGLLVTDLADGLGQDNDLIEILDQQIRVTYDPTLA